ncbi:MAG: [protein-PII] uridylyltransferase [Desulfobacteraceae bacterium]
MSNLTIKNGSADPAALLAQSRGELLARFLEGRAPDFLREHARLLDDYLRECFARSRIGPRMGIDKKPYAIVALGGYGRQEQCACSDVDLLLLFSKKVPTEAEVLIREIVYPLWDMGIEVGHATRSLKECIGLALNDYEVLTSLLDARFICGVSLLYSEMMEQVRKKILQRRSEQVVTWLIARNRERHRHFGDSAYLLEPNLKEGQGGLRDYHTMLWIARIKFNLRQPRDLEYYGCLSNAEYRNLRQSLAFIWGVRNRLHHLAGRKCDQLFFDHQIRLAEAMGYTRRNGQQPVELFMGELHGRMEFLKQQHRMFLYEQGYERLLKPRSWLAGKKKKPAQQTRFQGLDIHRGMLRVVSPQEVLRNPDLLMNIFEESARLKIPLSAEAKRLVTDFLDLVDAAFRSRAAVVKSFEKILVTQAPIFSVLNEMLNTGFLVRFIPEFKTIENRIQYDQYHLYPVDRHLLRSVRILKQFGTPEDPTRDTLCGELYGELKNKRPLLWATLLHDVGKGQPSGGHSELGAQMIRRLLAEKNLKPADIDTAEFLVRHHLLLIKTATRRDINDEETAINLARTVRKADRLKMLFLLTVADSIATGPNAWNDWSFTLLRTLFLTVLGILEKGELASSRAVKVVRQKKEALLASAVDAAAAEALETLFRYMSPRYLLFVRVRDLLEHARLYDTLGQAPFVWQITKSAASGTRRVTICAQDRPGLFASIAGVFTLNGIDILDAQVFTWKNNTALDIFEVKPPPDQLFETERWERAAGHLRAALDGRLDLVAALEEKMAACRHDDQPITDRPVAVRVDNQSSSFFTIIEVYAYDFPGLLFSITNCLVKCGLDIWVAKIATQVDQVVDVFYVRDFDGQKVDDPEWLADIRKTIIQVLAGGDRCAEPGSITAVAGNPAGAQEERRDS